MAFVSDSSGNSPIDLGVDRVIGSKNDVPALRPYETQEFTLSGTSQQTTVFNPATKYVRIVAVAGCYYDVGLNPTAVAGENLLPANAVETIEVKYPDKIALLQLGVGGLCNITETR